MNPSDLIAVLSASLVGSTHCALMCGPFLPLLSDVQQDPTPGQRAIRTLGYHIGRGIAYLSLGATAGLAGTALEPSAWSLTAQRGIALGMAAGLVLAALSMAWPKAKLTRLRVGPPGPVEQLKQKILGLRRQQRLGRFSLALGLGSALLPCAWLWSYVWLAATRSSLEAAMMTMGAFWLGTIPALSLVSFVAPALRQRLGRHAPKLGALALLLLAGWTLAERWPRQDGQPPAHCQPQMKAR